MGDRGKSWYRELKISRSDGSMFDAVCKNYLKPRNPKRPQDIYTQEQSLYKCLTRPRRALGVAKVA